MQIELDLTGLPVGVVAMIRQTAPSRQKLALAGVRAKEMWPKQPVLVGLIRAYLLGAPNAQDAEQLANNVLEIWSSRTEIAAEEYNRGYANAQDRYATPPPIFPAGE